MPQFFRKEIIPGIFIIISIALLIAFIFAINPQGLHNNSRQVHIVFDSIGGLREKAAVWFAGVEKYHDAEVGHVEHIEIIAAGEHDAQEYRIEVTLALNAEIPLKEGSTFRIATKGLAGYPHVEIVPGPPEAADLNLNTVHRGVPPPDDMFTTLQGLADVVYSMKLDTLSETARQTIVKIGNTADDLSVISGDVRSIVGEIKEKGQIPNIVSNIETLSEKSIATVDEVQITVAEARRFIGTMNSSAEKVEALIDTNSDDITVMLKNLRQTSEMLNTRIDSTFEKVEALLNRIDVFLADNKEEISAILVNLRATTQNAKLFTQDIKLNPWKLFLRKKEQQPQKLLQSLPDKGPVIQ